MLPAREPAQRILSHCARSLRLILPILSLSLAIWACGATPVITHLPASQLRLAIIITEQYYGIYGQVYGPYPYGDTSHVGIEVVIFEAANPEPVLLPKNTHLTCNGMSVMPPLHVCPRQPPGGAYRITYTDEHGTSATAVVPVPVGSFGLRYPHIDTGATVPIPTSDTLAIPYSAPTLSPDGGVVITGVTTGCGEPSADPQKMNSCGAVYYSAPDNTSETTSGGDGIFQLTGNFASFLPGPGSIELHMSVHVAPDQGGFDAVTATYLAGIHAPIVWTR